MVDMQTGRRVIVIRLERGIKSATVMAVTFVGMAMVVAFVYALARMLSGSPAAYIIAGLLTACLLILVASVVMRWVVED